MPPPSPLPSAQSIEALLTHREWVRALARRLLGQDADIDDVEQLTWIAAIRQPRLAAGTLRAFLARVVRNLALDRVRGRERRARHERRAARPEATLSAAETVARAEAHRRVVEAVLALDEPCRSTLLLRFFDGLLPGEIARQLGCDAEAVRTRIRRGLERVRERLGPRVELTLAPLLFVPGLLRRTGVLAMSMKKAVAVAAVVVAGGVALTAREWTTPPARVAPVAAASRRDDPPPAEGAPAESSRAAALVVSLRRPDGGGLRGTKLYRIDGSGAVVAEAVPDADGIARFDRRDDATFVLARLPGTPVAWVEVAPGATDAELVLAEGASLDGCLLVDGAPPTRAVELSLRAEGGRPGLPKVVRSAIDSLALDPDGAACETRDDGTFRFEGLPATEDAWIAVPPDFVLVTGGRGCRVAVPGPFVRLDALALPRLRGRVVFEGGAPVPGALLHAAWTTGERSGQLAVTASPDGRFDFPLPELASKDAALSYADAAAVTFGTRSLGAVGRGVHELGDLALPALLEGVAHLRVVDADGRPVEGAVARSEGATTSVLIDGDVSDADPHGKKAVPAGFVSRPSDPSGPDGVLRLPVCAKPYFARIRARGFEPLGRLIEVAGEETVVLVRTTLLTVRVGTAEADVPSGLVVVLSADRPLFPFESELFEEAGFSESRSSEEGEWYVWLPDEAGVARVHGLGPDVPVTVSVLDSFGAVQAFERVSLGKGEAREIAMRVDAAARTVRGTVRDASGTPVPAAEVIGWAGEGFDRVAYGETDPAGRFALEGARTRSVRLLVLADGFQPLPLVLATDREHEIRLERGRRVRLRVVDRAGAPVPDAEVLVEMDGFRGFPCDFWCGEEIEPGLYEIDGLPAGEVTVTVRTGDLEQRFRHDGGKPEGTLVLGGD